MSAKFLICKFLVVTSLLASFQGASSQEVSPQGQAGTVEFIFSIDTTQSVGPPNFTIPTYGTGYKYSVDCDNDNNFEATGQVGDYTCDYNALGGPGQYVIRIKGDIGDGTSFPRFRFNKLGEADELTELIQWGPGLWDSMESAFQNASNVKITAADWPDLSMVNDMSGMFRYATLANPDTTNWNTSNVNDMTFLFFDAVSAEPNTSNWNTAGVTDMSYMFSGATIANPDTSNWDTSQVTDMYAMFSSTLNANPDTSNWDTSQVTSMAYMFSQAQNANPDTSNWNVGAVSDMENMFRFITLSLSSYDAILNNFSSQSVKSGVNFSGGNSLYCADQARNDLINDHNWVISDGGAYPQCGAGFIFTIDTSLGDGLAAFTIPTFGSGYKYDVDCNNDGLFEATAVTSAYTCDYATLGGGGVYEVRILDAAGDDTGFPRFRFNQYGEADKLIELNQWGDSIWDSMEEAFFLSSNLQVLATDVPNLSQVNSARYMFSYALVADPDTTNWDTESITNMSGMFLHALAASPNTSNWNTVNVKDMSYLFTQAFAANPDTSGWNTMNVTDMRGMFQAASIANPDTSGWNTSNVTVMSELFYAAHSAKPDTSGWNTANVTDMNALFYLAQMVQPDTSGWDTSAVEDMSFMFSGTPLANPNTSGWDTSNVTTMQNMFSEANSANPDTSGWNTAKVTNMRNMFRSAVASSPDMSNWNIGDVITMQDMFLGVTLTTANYDALLTNFSAQTVQSGVLFNAGNSSYCANGARNSLINLNGWTVSDGGYDSACSASADDFVIRVDTSRAGSSASNEFHIKTLASSYSYNFNVDCDGDNPQTIAATAQTGDFTCVYPSSGIYSIRISDNAGDRTGFPQIRYANQGDVQKIVDITQWGTGKWRSMKGSFWGASNMTVTATDVPDLSSVKSLSRMFRGNDLANPDTSNWDTSEVTSMDGMFYHAPTANPDTSNWDTSQVTDMSLMFFIATKANPDTSNWNTSQVTDMGFMFSGAVKAIPNTSNWDTTQVTDMGFMFSEATNANPDTSGWNTSNVIDMKSMFRATEFANPDTSNWNTSNVNDMSDMFRGTDMANPDTSNWNTSQVTNMSGMFTGADMANPDVSNWNTSNVTNMNFMFYKSIAAVPDLSDWDVSAVSDMEEMFFGITLPTMTYDAILLNFSSQTLQTGVSFHGGDSKYCAINARNTLINSSNWSVTDAGLDADCNDVIFRNSFEIPVENFKAVDRWFEYDFTVLAEVKLDSFPELVAIGVNAEDKPVMRFHVRKMGEQLQIRISDLDTDAFDKNTWVPQGWQRINPVGLTELNW